MIPKLVNEYSLEYTSKVHKDKKTINILFNGPEQACLIMLRTYQETEDASPSSPSVK